MRAADGGWAARFLVFFVALGFRRFDSESTLLPTAANASRSTLTVPFVTFLASCGQDAPIASRTGLRVNLPLGG